MKYLNKLKRAERKEIKTRKAYVKSKAKCSELASKLATEYYEEDNQRSEALLYLQAYLLDRDIDGDEEETEDSEDSTYEVDELKHREFTDSEE